MLQIHFEKNNVMHCDLRCISIESITNSEAFYGSNGSKCSTKQVCLSAPMLLQVKVL